MAVILWKPNKPFKQETNRFPKSVTDSILPWIMSIVKKHSDYKIYNKILKWFVVHTQIITTNGTKQK